MFYQLFFYVPKSHLEAVKDAIFSAGAGRMGNYSHCSWETEGQGQFMPLPGSNPYVGKENFLEKVPEYKVETICKEDCLEAVIKALLASHPYETPAYGILEITGKTSPFAKATEDKCLRDFL